MVAHKAVIAVLEAIVKKTDALSIRDSKYDVG